MTTSTSPTTILTATPTAPVTVYYCKANLKTGLTVRLLQSGRSWDCSGISLQAITATMRHGNTRGKTRASGARCVLIITEGTIIPQPPELSAAAGQ